MDWSEIPLTRVEIADLIPLQVGLTASTVEAKRKAIREGEPIDAPKIFLWDEDFYVADGHHGIEAAHLEGFKWIRARIVDIGDEDHEGLEKAKKSRLKPSPHPHSDPASPKMRRIERRLARKLKPMLKEAGKKIAAHVLSLMNQLHVGQIVQKANEDDAEEQRRLNELLSQMLLDELVEFQVELETELSLAAAMAAENVIGGIMPTDYDSLVNRVFDKAADYAKERAGELIRFGPGGRAEGELADATRDMIRNTIEQGLRDNIGRDEISAALEEGYGFSPERADIIASTEIANANTGGELNAMREMQADGMTVKKRWLCEEDACDECQDNAAVGFIDIEEDFPSGDDGPTAHPNCRCALETDVQEPKVAD